MAEDVSASIRVGITTIMLSALATACINLFAIANGVLIDYSESFAMTVGDINSTTLMALNQERSVGAPTAYKLIQQHESLINEVKITYLDGTVSSDYKTLLKRAEKSVKVYVMTEGRGTYKIEVTEVQ